ncbi:MAG: DUF3343 domain-containing protein [Eubacteriales bacterium]|nr:DUF3343 domain-containing protein [Eubacteriales bacterium]
MENRYFMFPSITIAVKAKNMLENYGIHGYVQKTPKNFNKNSCGYSVLINNREDEALEILKSKGFVMLGVKDITV